MLTKTYPRIIDSVGELNPQLFREIKGRLKFRNVALVSVFSIIGQFFLYLCFLGKLPMSPIRDGMTNRYCTGEVGYSYPTCIADLSEQILTIKELWWLDIFTTMSVIGTFILLVIGSYLLIADISKEESKGTFNFIRLSPQSAWSIWGGKMLGVPILVYLFGALAIPLHFTAGLLANIPFHLILGFYLVLGASCFFFYSASLLLTTVNVKSSLGGFQAILGAGMIFFFLYITTSVALQDYIREYSQTTFDWLLLFNPIICLIYLAKSTFLAPQTVNYFDYSALMNLNWYGKFLWQNSLTGLGFILLNYSIWSFWIWQGLKRRFHNPKITVISKYDSYWLSACFIVLNLGFALQSQGLGSYNENLIILQGFNLILFLILITALSAQRQSLQDWARYRHQNTKAKRNLWRDLLLGEKSPAVAAIALNVLIVTLYLIPTILLFPLEKSKFLIIMGFVLGGAIVIIYATVMQLLLMLKNEKRELIAINAVIALMIAPFLSLLFYNAIGESTIALFGILTPMPLFAVGEVSLFTLIVTSLGYIVTLSALNWQMKRVLNKAGMSETKMLLAGKN